MFCLAHNDQNAYQFRLWRCEAVILATQGVPP